MNTESFLAAEAGTAHSTKGSGDGSVGNAKGISGIVSTGLGARWLSPSFRMAGRFWLPSDPTRIQGSRGALIAKQWGFYPK
jgi:hypothetical protein